jgi:hypothetical protein
MYAFYSTEEGDDPNAMGLRSARPTHWIWIYKFALKLKKSDIDAFVAHFRDRSAFYGKAAYVYRNIFGVESSVKTADGDWQYPRIVGDPVPPGRGWLQMTQREYDAWNTQAELQRELFGSDSEGEEQTEGGGRGLRGLQLDEDDYAIIEENTGIDMRRAGADPGPSS